MLTTLINNIAFLVALVAAGQLVVSRFHRTSLNREVLLGLLFGGVAVLGMANPLSFSPGVIFDGRSIVLAVAGVVGGGITAFIAAGMAALYRIQLGGSGAMIGVLVVLMSASMGVLARYWWQRRGSSVHAGHYFALGVVVQLAQLSAFTLLPNDTGYAFIEKAWWILLLFYPLATMLLCMLFQNYEQQLHDRQALQAAQSALIAEERASMERFHAYFDHSIVGLAITTLDRDWIEVNDALCRTLGYTRDELTRMTWTELSYPEDMAADMTGFERMLAGEINSYMMDKRFIHKDGHLVYSRLAVSRVRKPDGSLDYVIAMVEDISERKQVEQALRRNERIFSLFIENSPASIAMFDRDMKFIVVSRRFLIDFGLGDQNIIGRGHYEVFPNIPQRWREVHQRCLAGATEKSEEDQFLQSDGSMDWIRWEIRPWHEADNEIGGIILFCELITERKRNELELEQHRNHLQKLVDEQTRELRLAKETAETASIAKSAFLANMSHEIRTPLNAITGMVYILRRSGLSPHQIDKLDKIEVAGDHLLQTINAVLDLSKIEAGKFELEDAPVNLETLFGKIDSMLGPKARAKGLRFEIDVVSLPYRLRGDPTRLLQALLNYTANALKFTESGYIKVRVKEQAQSANSVTLRFEVEDSGIGIAPEIIPRLFSAFEQADSSTTREYGGSGLGLAITRKFAEVMGGAAGVTSREGEGSTFWFTAVLDKDGDIDNDRDELGLEAAEWLIRNDHAGKRILLVEDEAINREIAKMLLEDVGLEVDLANDGREAVEKAASGEYAALLMDMQMPIMDGLEATRQIRCLPDCRTTPILAMTANAFDENKQRCFDAGMDDFISKPVIPEVLYQTLGPWLDGQGRRSLIE